MSAKKGYSSKVIIRHLRQAKVIQHEGKTMAEVCRALCISDSIYYKWRKEYGDSLKKKLGLQTNLMNVIAPKCLTHHLRNPL